jgi:hypothetical protein
MSDQKSIFQIGESVFIDLMRSRRVLDGKAYKAADLTIDLRSTTFGDQHLSGSKSSSSLIRHQYVEMVARIA